MQQRLTKQPVSEVFRGDPLSDSFTCTNYVQCEIDFNALKILRTGQMGIEFALSMTSAPNYKNAPV